MTISQGIIPHLPLGSLALGRYESARRGQVAVQAENFEIRWPTPSSESLSAESQGDPVRSSRRFPKCEAAACEPNFLVINKPTKHYKMHTGLSVWPHF